MEDQLISFDTAVLAKEKGFNIQGYNCYMQDKQLVALNYNSFNIIYHNEGVACLAPTQSLLQRWLREKYKIHIKIHSSNTDVFSYQVYFMIDSGTSNNRYKEHIYSTRSLNSHEEALEVGLQEALKLIR